MPCYYPIDGWRSTEPNENGKYPIKFSRDGSPISDLIKLPCNNCIGCRLERSRQWAMRCVHEASLHDKSCFITLTYDDEHIPEGHTLYKPDFQKFMKRLRKQLESYPSKIRFFMGGEYGTDQDPTTTETIGRPHYHAVIFGYEFPMYPDKHYQTTAQGHDLYTSDFLTATWGKGFATVGKLTFDSAAYVARYCTKKINGPEADIHYQRVNPTTGEITFIQPEYGTASNKPGIAHDWFKKYEADLRKGFITINGVKTAIPKYYNLLQQRFDENTYDRLREKKNQAIDVLDPETNPERLRVKEKVRELRTKSLNRKQL